MAKPEQLELFFEPRAQATPNSDTFVHEEQPVPAQARDFLIGHGFNDYTIKMLARAHFNQRQSRGEFSHLKNGYRKIRTLDVPDPDLMRPLQRWLQEVALEPFLGEVSDIACGINGKQLPAMIEPHTNSRFFLKLDIESAYPSVDIDMLANILASRGETPSGQWLAVLRQFCMGKGGGLATGGIVSPLLFNLYMAPLDDEFKDLAEVADLIVTRYMDDIVFSSDSPIGKRRSKTIKGMLREYGLGVNQHKVKYHDLESDGPFMVTGLQLNPGGSWQLANRYLRNIDKLFTETLIDIQTNGDIDLETMGVVRGLRGHLLACTAQDRPKIPLEQRIFENYHLLEKIYRRRHPV